jgi:DNA helicase-2/ATP-dependent DNA helicase PcrA
MDRATQVQQAAARVWEEYRTLCGGERLHSELPLLDLLIEVIQTVYRLTVSDDDTFLGTNIEGELNPLKRQILYRADLSDHRAAFVVAHELGHFVLKHTTYRVLDTTQHLDDSVSTDALGTEAELADQRGYSERVNCELDANAFANELLAPCGLVRQLLLQNPGLGVAEIATTFGVPQSQIRLAIAAGLLKGRLIEQGAVSEQAGTPPELDPRQQEAVEVAAPARIIAGPGAGKTRVLVERFAWLVNQGIEPRRILALTFANKAAGEMRERLTQRVPPELAPAIEVSTFHAFGLKLLQEYGQHLGLSTPLRLVSTLDALILLRPQLSKLPLGSFEDPRSLLKNVRKLLSVISRAKDENAGPERWLELAQGHEDETLRDVGIFYAAYQEHLKATACLDYADLIYLALKLLELPEVGAEIRSQYEHILVDEFQDINYSSGLLVKALDGGRECVWAVGDPRQSIYGFRGASPVNLGKFPEYYPKATTIQLDRNYRSREDIVVAGQCIPIALPDESITPVRLTAHRGRAEAGPSVEYQECAEADQELHFIVKRLLALQQEGVALAHIAVLCRKSSQAQKVADVLTQRGLAHTWGGALEDRLLFKVLYGALLLAADEPQGLVSLTTLAPLYGVVPGAGSQFALSEPDRRAVLAVHRRYKRDGKCSVRALLEAASSGKIEGLSAEGIALCQQLKALAEALVPAAPSPRAARYVRRPSSPCHPWTDL